MNNALQLQTVEVEYHPITKKKVRETYLDDEGRPHCDKNPAILTFGPTGIELSRIYCQHGVITRNDGPAIETIHLENLFHELVWVKDGKKGRDDGPAEIKTDILSGVEFSHAWYKNDLMHREDGYALMTFDRGTGECDGRFYVLLGEKQRFIEFPEARPEI